MSHINALFVQSEPALPGGEAINLTYIINSYNKKQYCSRQLDSKKSLCYSCLSKIYHHEISS